MIFTELQSKTAELCVSIVSRQIKIMSFRHRLQNKTLFVLCVVFCVGALSINAQQNKSSNPEKRKRIVTQPKPKPTPISEPPIDENEVVRVESALTNVLFTAVDKDKGFITTIQKEDLRVFENDAPQQIFTFERQTDLSLSLIVLIDTSISQEFTLPQEKSAAISFLNAVLRPDRDSAAVISFTGIIKIEQVLTNDKTSLRSAVERVEIIHPPDDADNKNKSYDEDDFLKNPTAYTSIWDSIADAIKKQMAQTPERTRRAIILLTDGDDTSSQIKYEQAAEFAIKNNTVVYSIGIGDRENYEVKEGELKKFSGRTGGRAFFPKSEVELSNVFTQIETELRSQYLIAYVPTNAVQDGSYRRIRMEISNPKLRKQKLRLLYRQGYYAKQQ
jgi:VWFA-related protein